MKWRSLCCLLNSDIWSTSCITTDRTKKNTILRCLRTEYRLVCFMLQLYYMSTKGGVDWPWVASFWTGALRRSLEEEIIPWQGNGGCWITFENFTISCHFVRLWVHIYLRQCVIELHVKFCEATNVTNSLRQLLQPILVRNACIFRNLELIAKLRSDTVEIRYWHPKALLPCLRVLQASGKMHWGIHHQLF